MQHRDEIAIKKIIDEMDTIRCMMSIRFLWNS